jgi:hypothetical protein
LPPFLSLFLWKIDIRLTLQRVRIFLNFFIISFSPFLYSMEAPTPPANLISHSLELSLKEIGKIVGDSGPTCFIARCYTGEDPKILREQYHISECLTWMGIRTVLDVNGDCRGLPIGSDTQTFMEQAIAESNFVLCCLTPRYLERYNNPTSGVSIEVTHIVDRINKKIEAKEDIDFFIPLLMEGDEVSSVPPILRRFLYMESYRHSTFDIKCFLKEMWALFETRFFKKHPRLKDIQTFLSQSAVKLDTRLQGLESSIVIPLKTRLWGTLFPLQAFNLPDYNELFIESSCADGEESYLTHVWRNLKADSTVILTQKPSKCTVSGMGGVGKTQLALAYAHEAYRHNAYDVIYWIHSETEEALVQDYKMLLEKLEAAMPVESDEKVIERFRFILPQKSKKWLLVYDNAPSCLFLKGKIPQKGGDVLITSRDQQGWLHDQLSLNVFTPQEAVRYLLEATKRGHTEKNRTEVLAVTATVGCLPLALSQVAGYMRENPELSFQEYAQLFQRKTVELLSYQPEEEEYPHSVLATFSMSMSKLQEPLAKDILLCASYLGAEEIPEWIMKGLVQLGHTSQNEETFNRALNELRRYSLIKRDSSVQEVRSFSLHRLVQCIGQITQEILDHDDKARGLKVLIRSINLDRMPYQESICYLNRIFRDGGKFRKDLNDRRVVSMSEDSLHHLQIIHNHFSRLREKGLIERDSLNELSRKLGTIMESLLDIKNKGLKHYFATRNPFEENLNQEELEAFHTFIQRELQIEDISYQELWAQVESAVSWHSINKANAGSTYLIELLKKLAPLTADKRAIILYFSMFFSEGLDISQFFWMGIRIAQMDLNEEMEGTIKSNNAWKLWLRKEQPSSRVEFLRESNNIPLHQFRRCMELSTSLIKNHTISHPLMVVEFFYHVVENNPELFERYAEDMEFFSFLADDQRIHDLVRTIYCLHLADKTSSIERIKSDRRIRGISDQVCWARLQNNL